MRVLEYESNCFVSKVRQIVFGQVGGVLTRNLDPARGSRVESADDMEQGALSRPRGTGQSDTSFGFEIEGNSLEDINPLSSKLEGFSQLRHSKSPVLFCWLLVHRPLSHPGIEISLELGVRESVSSGLDVFHLSS